MIRNPILPGFNPDPSICRVGDDYYIATSTFEWYPGVQIHHSRDLENWRLISRPLDREALLNMVGVPDSCGVWAPCLSWSDNRFWLCYTVTRRFDGNFKDTPNFLTTCTTIDGTWSDPVHLNSSGFDPSLFHDDDGRKWLLSMIWDHRPGRSFFGGIALQEYLPGQRKLVGDRAIIFEGTSLDCTEGPHLYKYDGYFYLMTAEGGTGYEHAVTMARSRNIHGPYMTDPEGPIITSVNAAGHPLQRTGHADLVELPDGRFYMAHLASRPLPGTRRSPLGRETALQELVRNEQGWFRMKDDSQLAALELDGPGLPEFPAMPDPERDDFDEPHVHPVFQWLRTPHSEAFLSLQDRPGHLRLYGMDSPGSHFHQALVARRQTHFNFDAETILDFDPAHFQQQAGLMLYYNASKFHFLFVSRDQQIGKHLAVMSCEGNAHLETEFPAYRHRVALPERMPVHLRARVRTASLRFAWSLDGSDWSDWPVELDASLLSDEVGEGAQFTGNFVGVSCHDLEGTRRHADFDWFAYHGWN